MIGGSNASPAGSATWTTINGAPWHTSQSPDRDYRRHDEAAPLKYREPVYIKLNNYYVSRTTAAQRRKVTCHEVGHALGILEDFPPVSPASCMNADKNAWYEYPSTHDFDVLRQMYKGHSDW